MQFLTQDRITAHRPALALALGLAVLAGCATTHEGGMRDTVTQNVGRYPHPPSGLVRVRLGVPGFKVIRAGGMSRSLDSIAADQMTTLAALSNRFDVIERAQLTQLIDEQNHEGTVRGNELAQVGRVRGVDYLLLGRVTNFRVKAEKTKNGFNLGGLSFLDDVDYLRGAGISKAKIRIKAECGVDLRLVDPSTGAVVVAHFGEFERIDAADMMGISLAGMSSEGSAEIEITDDDEGQVLRLALDDALRKMMPEIDRVLVDRAVASAAPSTPSALPNEASAAGPLGGVPTLALADAGGTPDDVSGPHFCSACGKDLAPKSLFCGSCGTAVR